MPRTKIDPVTPSAEEAIHAGTARAALAAGHRFATEDLPPLITRLLMEILEQTAAGKAVALVSIDAETSTQQAADLLNVSRPFVVGLVENGILPARMVGKHRRLLLRDVLAYKADQFAKAQQALDEIVAFDQEFGLI